MIFNYITRDQEYEVSSPRIHTSYKCPVLTVVDTAVRGISSSIYKHSIIPDPEISGIACSQQVTDNGKP